MKSFILSLLIALFVASAYAHSTVSNDDDLWVVLVAGSNGYYNYRHQSDICHAYQILKKNGISDDRIITMMEDDIASNPQNPVPGKIFNVINGDDVYAGVPKDYVGTDVTPTNFMNVLSGKDMTGIGSGKTVKSTANSKIFVYFADHGGPGLIAMPHGGYLYTKDLQSTVSDMFNNKQYKELVLYIEACESGSMGDQMGYESMNAYMFTASNPHVSSYACDYDAKVKTYLNDCWSRNWMVDTENNGVSQTFLQQFNTVKSLTTESPACAYGDLSIQSELLSEFMANSGAARGFSMKGVYSSQSKISSRDVLEDYLKKRVEHSNNSFEELSARSELNKYYQDAAKADVIYNAFAHTLEVDTKPSNDDDKCHTTRNLNHDCIKEATIRHNEACGEYTEYSFKYSHFISRACEKHDAKTIGMEFNKICGVFA
jgi:legumain